MIVPKRYRADLLLLWRAEGEEGVPAWWASLEDARSGNWHGFADLPQLYVHWRRRQRRELRQAHLRKTRSHEA
jgi:hypothetical protein